MKKRLLFDDSLVLMNSVRNSSEDCGSGANCGDAGGDCGADTSDCGSNDCDCK